MTPTQNKRNEALLKQISCVLILLLWLYIISFGTPIRQEYPDLTNLPDPVLDDHPEWVALFDSTWRICKDNLHEGRPNSGFIDLYIDEAMSYWKIWQWDQCFISMYAKYSNGEFPDIEPLENFYRKQHKNGFICRELKEEDGTDVYPNESQPWPNPNPNPPLYSLAEWDYYLVTGDASHFSKEIISNGTDPGIKKTVFQRMVDYFFWVRDSIRHDDGYYTSDYWANGMDDSPRNSIGAEGAWQCITTQQGLAALYLSKIAEVLGDETTKAAMLKEYNEHKDLVNSTMWDPVDNFYYDLDSERKMYKGWNGQTMKTVASFWPMLAEFTSEEQAQKLVEHIINPAEFWLDHVIPTLSKDSYDYNGPTGEYWRGAIWAPTNYSTVRGLMACGRDSLCKEIAENHIDNIDKLYKKGGLCYDGKTYYTVWENFAPELIAPSKDSYPNFVGWSGLGPIAMLIENVIGLRLNAPEDKILWILLETGRHGIENLHYNGGIIKKIICNKRNSTDDDATVVIDTDKPFSLTCRIGGKDYTLPIKVGEHTYQFGGSTNTLLSAIDNIMSEISLHNTPNPFTTTTNISFSIPAKAKIRVSIFNMQGRLVERLFYGIKQPGKHTLTWDGNIAPGCKVSDGIYVIRIETAEGYSVMNKIVKK